MSAGQYRGAAFVTYLERGDYYQGEIAPIGGLSDTLLSFSLADDPISAASICLFLGHGGATPAQNFGEMLLLRQGVHYRVSGRHVFWLRTAPFALTADSVIGVTYLTMGFTA